jgi:uncharacterized protein (DUF3820 family)
MNKFNQAFTPKCVINDDHILLIGKKYKGRTIEEIIAFDPNYIDWLRSKPWAQNDKQLMELIKDVTIPDVTFGKYKGKTLEWIMANDENYMKFLYNSEWVRDKHPELKAKVDQIYI